MRNKRFILNIFLLFLTSLFAQGQVITITPGLTFSKIDWQLSGIQESPYDKALTGMSLLIGADYLEREHFYLSSTMGYLRKGGKGEIELTNLLDIFSGKIIVEKPMMHYLTFNTTANFHYWFNNKLAPFVGLGPRTDYLISYNDYLEGLEDQVSLSRFSYGLIFTGGLKYRIARFQIGVNANYYLNFNKLATWDAGEYTSEGKADFKTSALNLSIGYRLGKN